MEINKEREIKKSHYKEPILMKSDHFLFSSDENTRDKKEIKNLRYAIDQAAIVAVTDIRGDILFVNDKFCEISQYSSKELIGQNHRIVNSGHHPKSFFKELWNVISRGKVWRGEIKNKAKDGSYYWVFTTIIPLKLDGESTPDQYLSIRFDITDKKEAEKKLEYERERLVQSEKMASLGEMAAGIAHELGNPIAAIQGRIELLEMQLNSGKLDHVKIKKAIVSMAELSERMTKIIRGMRALARDGSQDPFYKTNIIRVISDVLEFSYEKLKKSGIHIEFPFLEQEVWVFCRETQISQVFVNLLNNARDAIENFEDKWIKIDVNSSAQQWVEISVTDCGNGIPSEIQEKILQPFFTTKEVGRGSGLGLSISKTIIESHGGEFFIDKNSPHTKFVLRLPKKIHN